MYKIKNWQKLQHFKDRRPPWVKLYRDIIEDPDWHDLSGDDAKALVSLWLIASEDELMQGNLPSIRKLAFRLRTTEVKLKQTLNRLSHWLYQDDITVISVGYQVDAPETETETETENRERVRGRDRNATTAKLTPCQIDTLSPMTPTPATVGRQKHQEPPLNHQGTTKEKSAPAAPLPGWLDLQSWKDYLEARKVMKAPMTDKAKSLAIAKLAELMKSGHDPTAVLNQSIYNGWKGLFPIKNETSGKGQTRHEQLADKLADLTGSSRRQSVDTRTINGTAERLD